MNRNKFITEYTRINRKYEEKFMPLVQRAIHSKVKEVISNLKDSGVDSARNYLLTNLGNSAMQNCIYKLYQTVGRKHAQINYSRLLVEQRKGFGFNAEWTAFINNYLQNFLTSKITFDIANSTKDALLRALTIMTTDGLSTDMMIERLKEWPYERYQAARIVRTEVNRAANVGATAQVSTSEYQQVKEWISIKDFRTRGNNPNDHANHKALDGTTINEDDVFIDPRNDDSLQFPGDPNGEAESTINCRCAVGYTFKRDSDGNLIRKRRSTTVLFPSQVRRPQIVNP